MPAAAYVALVVIAAAASYKSYQQQQAAAKEQKKANKISQAEQDAQRQTQIRQQVREDRVRRAQIIQSSENTGVADSSGQLGAVSAIGTQTAANIGTLGRGAVSSNGVFTAQQNAADHISRANMWNEVSSLSSSAASAVGGSAGFGSSVGKLGGTPNTGVNAPPKG